MGCLENAMIRGQEAAGDSRRAEHHKPNLSCLGIKWRAHVPEARFRVADKPPGGN